MKYIFKSKGDEEREKKGKSHLREYFYLIKTEFSSLELKRAWGV